MFCDFVYEKVKQHSNHHTEIESGAGVCARVGCGCVFVFVMHIQLYIILLRDSHVMKSTTFIL